jgi:cell division protein FtsB
MLDRIKNINYQNYLREMKDVRMVGLLVFAGIMLLVTWSGIGVIQTNYDLQKKISSLEQAVDVRQLENSNLKLRNEYYETDQYLELQARRQFSKAAPGETLLIVPRTVSLSHSVPELEVVDTKIAPKASPKPSYQKHFEAWTDFLFRRHPLNS